MDAAEKALLLKILEGFATNEKIQAVKKDILLYEAEPGEYLGKLTKRAGALSDKTEFKVGEFVIWKDGLKNKRIPAYSQPCIVLEVYNSPIKDENSIVNESLDIKLAFITEGDEFLAFSYDSSRFKIFNI